MRVRACVSASPSAHAALPSPFISLSSVCVVLFAFHVSAPLATSTRNECARRVPMKEDGLMYIFRARRLERGHWSVRLWFALSLAGCLSRVALDYPHRRAHRRDVSLCACVCVCVCRCRAQPVNQEQQQRQRYAHKSATAAGVDEAGFWWWFAGGGRVDGCGLWRSGASVRPTFGNTSSSCSSPTER